ncbi:unnamed protein product [Orchesella dallaii]|uniref:Ig-like domain-containing protein n=1 Tax=Orchesella dallaii TaxID=48710 RepID=A0ABP1PP95_9HEXA
MTPERVSEFNEDLDEPMTQSYRLYTYLSFENIKFFSSTFACQSVNKKRLSSSTHLYKLSMDEIERKGQTIQLTFDKKQNSPRQLELPCRPASPTASIFLQKQTQVSIWENGKVSTIPVWNEYRGSKKFDPKTGITLTLPENQIFYNSNPDGLYKCTLNEGSDDDYVLVNVTTKSVEPDKKVFHSKFTLKANASFGSLETNSSEISSSFEIYKCCSGVPLKPPSLIVKNCDSLLECDIEKARLLIEAQHISLIRSLVSRFNHSSDCSIYVVYGLSSIFMCEGENVDVSQQYFQMFQTPENDGNKSRVNRSFYEPNSIEWNAKVERRIVISITRPDGGSLSENDGNTEVFYKRSHHFDDDAKIYISQTIFQVNSDIYEGESISFMCLGLYLFHAEGGYIRINWKNGTRTVLPDFGNENIMVQFSNKLFSDALTVNPIFIKPIEASRDMRSVECFQPVWNESSWERMEMSLEVKASFEPVFSGLPEEIVYFNLNEKECEITCQLSGGTPLPKTIEVTKDEKSLVVNEMINLLS